MLYMFFAFSTTLNNFLITEVSFILKSLSFLIIHIVFVIHIGLNLSGMFCVCVCVCLYIYINLSNFLFNCIYTGPEVA